MKNSTAFPYLLASDATGKVFEIPELFMAGASLSRIMLPDPSVLIPLPHGSSLYMLANRHPVGYNPCTNSFVEVKEYNGMPVFAVAAFMAPAYLQILSATYTTGKGAPRLPLYCYTAAGWKNNTFYCAGLRIDADKRQDLTFIDCDAIDKNARLMLKRFPKNRLVRHLVENCVFRYGCPAARNFVLGRWECPIPIAKACNCSCIGCLSKQPKSSGIVASHERIAFTPTPGEIAEFCVPHLAHAPRPVVSFGQGCEGEPLSRASVIEESIRLMRKKTRRGIINLNTNASTPAAIERLCKAGLDSIRVSMNSAQKKQYNAYYRPRTYSFEDAVESLRIMRRHRRWSSINYLMFPGFTDTATEIKHLELLINKVELNMIQTRNLNIDPEVYKDALELNKITEKGIGIRNWVERMKKKYPNVKLGYFNPPLTEMKKYGYISG